MTSNAEIIKEGCRWIVKVTFGPFTYKYGPYRWHWVARFVAWKERNTH